MFIIALLISACLADKIYIKEEYYEIYDAYDFDTCYYGNHGETKVNSIRYTKVDDTGYNYSTYTDENCTTTFDTVSRSVGKFASFEKPKNITVFIKRIKSVQDQELTGVVSYFTTNCIPLLSRSANYRVADKSVYGKSGHYFGFDFYMTEECHLNESEPIDPFCSCGELCTTNQVRVNGITILSRQGYVVCEPCEERYVLNDKDECVEKPVESSTTESSSSNCYGIMVLAFAFIMMMFI